MTDMKKRIYIIIGIIAVFLVAGFFWVQSILKSNHIAFWTDDSIELTPTQIQSIKDIGEWEFLAISTEEMVDTIRKGIFTDDELVRIYYGTLRLGVNMHQVEPGWIQTSGDSINVNLPKIGLLDKDFIDEARTKPFYECGSWKAADKEALYKRAYNNMLRHCLTKENLAAAESNAEQQFRNMMKSMGFNHITITFKK